MICRNLRSGDVVAERVQDASGMLDRLVGLMFRPSLGKGCGMLIARCAAVHTCFMRFDMDAVFVDRAGHVLRVIPQMRPWRFSPWVWGAESVLELPGGAAAGHISAGDVLSFE